jgi:hypothetical protein
VGKYGTLGSGFDRIFRNTLNKALDDVDTDIKAQKKRVDDLIIGNPQPSEVVDSRGGFPILRDRLEDLSSSLAQNTTNLTEIIINVKRIPNGTIYNGSPLASILGDGADETQKLKNIIAYYRQYYNYEGFTLKFPAGHYYFTEFPLYNEVSIKGSGKRATIFHPIQNGSTGHFFYVASAPVGWASYEDFGVYGLSTATQNPILNPSQSCFKIEAQYFGTSTGGMWNCSFKRIFISGFAKAGFEWISNPTEQGDMANQFINFEEVEVYRINTATSYCIKGGGNQFTYTQCEMDTAGSTQGVGTNIETYGVCTFNLLTTQNAEFAIVFNSGTLNLFNPWFENNGKGITSNDLEGIVNVYGGYFGNTGHMTDNTGYCIKQVGMKSFINVYGARFAGTFDKVYIEPFGTQGGVYLYNCKGVGSSYTSYKTMQIANSTDYIANARTVYINSGGVIQTLPKLNPNEMLTYVAFEGNVTVKTGGNITLTSNIHLRNSGDAITFVRKDLGSDYTIVGLFKHETKMSSPPTSSAWALGDKAYNSVPVSGGYEGWICTTAGTANNTAWVASTAYTVNQVVNANGKVYKCTVAGTSGTTAPSHTSGTATDGTVTWSYVDTLAVFKTFGLIS